METASKPPVLHIEINPHIETEDKKPLDITEAILGEGEGMDMFLVIFRSILSYSFLLLLSCVGEIVFATESFIDGNVREFIFMPKFIKKYCSMWKKAKLTHLSYIYNMNLKSKYTYLPKVTS